MKVTYSGASPDVVVYDRFTDREYVFTAGNALEVPDDLGQRLADQAPADWTAKGYEPGPAESAEKAVWVEYRTAQGHVVDGLTRQQLIDLPAAPARNEEEG